MFPKVESESHYVKYHSLDFYKNHSYIVFINLQVCILKQTFGPD